jgi:transcriptional regulator with XRE-family HTH domain
MSQPTYFAGRLRTLRESAGLSQYALAKRAGLSKQGMSRLELGEREPTWVTVQRLAAALGVSFEAFADPDVARQAQNDEPPGVPGRPRKAPARTPGPKKPRGRPGKER